MAFINTIGTIAKYALCFGWLQVLTLDIYRYALDLGTDDHGTDIFFYTMPEVLLQDTEVFELTPVWLAGLNFLLFEREIESFSEAQQKFCLHLRKKV